MMKKEIPIERKALFNLVRMQWLQNPSIDVEEWQVENLREQPLEELFNRLQQQEIWLDKAGFLAYAEENETPEDLADQLVGDRLGEELDQDRVYLIFFELWRRLLPEKQSLTIFCDELDHLIWQYDHQESPSAFILQDSLENLKILLERGSEEEHSQTDVFEAVSARCANDLESFIYDFISDEIDERELDYAQELVDDFSDYMSDKKWFDLLKCRILTSLDQPSAKELLENLILKNSLSTPETDFLLEALNILIDISDDTLFHLVIKDILQFAENEDQFQELLQISYEYFLRQNRNEIATKIDQMLEERGQISTKNKLFKTDPAIKQFLSIVSSC